MSRATTAKRAEEAIRFFEDSGREVSGVTFKGTEFKIDFAKQAAKAVNEADLIDMSK